MSIFHHYKLIKTIEWRNHFPQNTAELRLRLFLTRLYFLGGNAFLRALLTKTYAV